MAYFSNQKRQAIANARCKESEFNKTMTNDNLVALFNFLDTDYNGFVDPAEFALHIGSKNSAVAKSDPPQFN